ncbi:MAG: VacB/RNase II family 3'-5' exoribonuclease, partial [Myxococcales bacterium]|nr:VacB/RNase II family 3'-5' exoribonuclease [Myxococcales bacterium]
REVPTRPAGAPNDAARPDHPSSDGAPTERFAGRSPGRAGQPGRLTVHPRGFGFVAVDDGTDDVYVAEHNMGAALHGDRVEILSRPSPKGREGIVIAVLARGVGTLTGSLRRLGRDVYLEADDPRLRSPMPVEAPPAKYDDADVFLCEITHYPQDDQERPTVRVLEALGARGTTEVEVAKIKIREGIVEEFPPDVVEEAGAFGARVSPQEKRDREDLRELDLVTIDPEDARDHDDAIFVERKDGGYRVVVAIADVSHYVRPGTAIDREALHRGTSIYLPDRAIPMLPAELSSNLASLVPKRDRLCLGVDVTLSRHGEVQRSRYVEGVMRSGGRLTYEGVARALDLTKEGDRQPAADRRKPMLTALLELARTLRKRRLERGALDFDLPEARIHLDDARVEPLAIERSKSDPGVREAYRMVEEMMLLANEVVARDLTERGVPAIYRVHGPPDDKKLESFCELATALGHALDVDDARDPRSLTAFLRKIDGEPQAPVLRYLLLRAMQQAVYSTQAGAGHFGLAAADYLHFTSPIRRYPDVTVHRVVRKVIHGEPVDAAVLRPRLQRDAVEASHLERRAASVERDVVALYRVILMRDRIGDEFDATVSGLSESGIYATLDSPFAEVLVPVERLEDFFELDRLGVRLVGNHTGHSFALGDRIRVRLEEASVERRQLIALPVWSKGHRRRARHGGGKRRDGAADGRSREDAKPAPKAASKRARPGAGAAKGAGVDRADSARGAEDGNVHLRERPSKSKRKRSGRPRGNGAAKPGSKKKPRS